jgi:hypothetical protein
MADKKRWSLKGTMRKFFSKTDIPPKVTTQPGHTVRTKNVTYMSGPSTWKNRVKAEAASSSHLGVTTTPVVPPSSQVESGSVLVISNGTMLMENGRGRYVASDLGAGAGSRGVQGGASAMTVGGVPFSTLPPVLRAQQMNGMAGNGRNVGNVNVNGVNGHTPNGKFSPAPQTLPKPAKPTATPTPQKPQDTNNNAHNPKAKNHKTFRNYVYINEYDDSSTGVPSPRPSNSSSTPSPRMELHITSPYLLGRPNTSSPAQQSK